MDTSTIAVIVSVVGVGAALGWMIRGLRQDMDTRIDGLDKRIRTLELSFAKLAGLLEGLGVTGRVGNASAITPQGDGAD